jgi:hypothetical protein
MSTFTSCSNGGTNASGFKDDGKSTDKNFMSLFEDDDEKIADKTFNKIIAAVESNDNLEMVNIFSNTVKNDVNLSQSVTGFYDFIDGDIVSFSSASEAGVGTDYQKEKGKKKKEIQSAFCITTTENTYYIAIKECVKDEFDDNNIGVVSIYIIKSNDWKEDYIYRGDGKWTPGINIVDH